MNKGILGLVALAVAGGLLLGCGRDSDAPKYRELEGRIDSIDLESGVVTMMWFSPKRKEEIPLPGKLDRDAEILIDGRTAELKDLREDDWVRVRGREERHAGQRQLIATYVEVDREGGRSSNAATRPAAGRRTESGEGQ